MKLFQPIQDSIESKETQENLIDRGQLQVNVTSSVNAFPVKEARISISYTGIPESILEQVVTDSSGQTEVVELNAPPEEWSLDENEERQPYSEYTLNIEAEGFESISVSGTEILTKGSEQGRRAGIRHPCSYFIWKLSSEDCRGRD